MRATPYAPSMNLLLPLLATLASAGPTVVVAPQVAIVQAIELPIVARDLRHAGGLEVDLQITLSSARRHQLPPGDVVLVFRDYVRYGPVYGFGPFVVARWDEGLRGKALARAIHREHAWSKRGNGHGPFDAKHGGKHADEHAGVWGVGNGHGNGNNGNGYGSHGKGPPGHVGKSKGKGHDKGKK